MKATFHFALILCCAASGIVSGESPDEVRAQGQETMKAAAASERNEPLQLMVELRDGSQWVGVPAIATVAVRTSFAKVDLPLKLVATIELGETGRPAKVSCTNGDLLQGVLDWSTLTLTTSFAKVSIPVKEIVRISAKGAAAAGLAGSLKEGLVLYYSFDHNDEDMVRDQSGNGFDGKIHGARWTKDGAVGGALNFSGMDQYVAIPTAKFPAEDAPRTLAAWVYENTLNSRYYVVGYGGDAVGSEFRISLNEFEPGQFSLETCFGGWHSSKSLSAKRWYHLAVTYQKGGRPVFYLDGTECSGDETWLSPDVRTVSGGGAIATRGSCEGGTFLDGTIDEVMIWERALSASEIKALCARHVGFLK